MTDRHANVVDTVIILLFMAAMLYLAYRIWTPLWNMLTFVLKLCICVLVLGLLLTYFWPEGLVSGWGIGSAVREFTESRALKIIFSVIANIFEALANVDWGRFKREWTDKGKSEL